MKALCMAIVIICLLVAPVMAEDKPTATYSVKVNISFNAVSVQKAAEIFRQITMLYGDACDVEIKVIKNSDGASYIGGDVLSETGLYDMLLQGAPVGGDNE